MATQKQIDANRRNAQKSTGPKTPEGKTAVRLNSLQHGLRANTIILPGESREEYDQLHAEMESEWRPQSATARFYLDQMVIAQWKLRRLEVAEAHLLSQDLEATKQIPLLDYLSRCQNRLERSFTRAQRELERLQGPLSKQPAPELRPQPVSRRPAPQPEPSAKWVCSANPAVPPAS